MSNPEEANTCVIDTQETYYEDANESFKINETQNTCLNESQDFNLVVSEGDDSMVEQMKQTQDGKSNLQKSVEQTDPQQIPEANPRTAKEDETIVDEENEAIEKTEGNVSRELCESEKKDDLFDEDEVIQGTPPQTYSPSRKMGSVDVMSLKRKASAVDEPPVKIPRTTSARDATNLEKQFEEESQFCDSDDSYQDLFKNIDKNVIIEETQDPTNLEFTQNSVKIPTEHAAETTDDDKARERRIGQVNQQRDEASSEKCRDLEKDDNLKVSAKLTDPRANDSTVVLRNYNGAGSQQEDSLPIETKGDIASTSATIANENLNSSAKLTDTSANYSTVVNVNHNGDNLSIETKRDDASTSVVIADDTSGTGTLDETESVQDTETVSYKTNEVKQSNCVESTEKTIDDEEISSSQTKSRISVELIFEANRAAGDGDGKSKPQVVQIDDDGEKILDSSAEMMYDRQSTKTKGPEVVEIDDSHEKIVLDLLGKNSEIQVVEKSYESKSSSYDYKSMESMKESSLDSKLTDKKLVNGSTESKRSDTDVTLSLDSDTFSISDEIIVTHDIKKLDSAKGDSFASKDVDNLDFISISDHETSNVEEKNKSDNMLTKTVQVSGR